MSDDTAGGLSAEAAIHLRILSNLNEAIDDFHRFSSGLAEGTAAEREFKKENDNLATSLLGVQGRAREAMGAIRDGQPSILAAAADYEVLTAQITAYGVAQLEASKSAVVASGPALPNPGTPMNLAQAHGVVAVADAARVTPESEARAIIAADEKVTAERARAAAEQQALGEKMAADTVARNEKEFTAQIALEERTAADSTAMWKAVEARRISNELAITAETERQSLIRGESARAEAATVEAATVAQYALGERLAAERVASNEKEFGVQVALEERQAAETTAMWNAVEKRRIANEMEITGEAERQSFIRGQAARAEAATIAAAEEKATLAANDHTKGLITQRYAMYDIASTTGVMAAATLGTVAAFTAVAVARQKAFADVQRTTGLAVDDPQLAGIQRQLIDITHSVPLAYAAVTEIATQGAQLNVAAADLGTFTHTIAEFSATTDVTTEAATLGLGKLGNILGVTSDGYHQLANEIAYAGVKSAATESQILSVAAEVGPAARSYGFAADQVIGLSTAYASLQIPAERARGVTLQVFNSIDNAVSAGGEKLQNYAAISGTTSAKFAEGWKTSSAATVQSFIAGLGASDDLSGALNTLGLTGIRTNSTLRSMAGNVDLVNASFANAAAGKTNSFLDDSAATKFATVSAKLTEMASSVGEFGAAFGGPGMQAVIVVIDMITGAAQGMAKFFSTQFGASIAGGTTVVLLLAGAILGLVSILAAGTAALYAMRTAATGLDGRLSGVSFQAARVAASFAGITISAREAAPALATVGGASVVAGDGAVVGATGVTALKVALRGLMLATGIGIVVAVLGGIAEAMMNTAATGQSAADSTEKYTKSLNEQSDALLANAAALKTDVEAASSFETSQANTEGSLFALGQSLQKNGKDFTAYSEGGRANITALQSTIASMVDQSAAEGGGPKRLANLLSGLSSQLEATGASSSALSLVQNAMDATGVAADKASVTSNSMATGLEHVTKAAAKAADAVRTVADYASDLGTVFDSALDMQFGQDNALDTIATQFQSMQKTADDAKKSVKDLAIEIQAINATIRGLQADNAADSYFLSVANKYGDVLRASKISADIAKNNAAIAAADASKVSKTGDLASAQDVVNASLTGNSAAALRARGDVQALVGAYEGYIKKLAESGMSQEDLAVQVGVLKGKFSDQLHSLGYGRDAADKYTGAFDTLAEIIRKFPRDINFEVDKSLSIADQVIANFLAKHAKHSIDIPVVASEGTPSATAVGDDIGKKLKKSAVDAFGEFRLKPFTGGGSLTPDTSTWTVNTTGDKNGSWWNTDGGYVGYANGGYTGDGAKYDERGPTHAGEFVFSRQAVQNVGVESLAYAHTAALSGGGSNGNGGSGAGNAGSAGMAGMVSLSPDDRAMFRDMAERIGNIEVEFVEVSRAAATGDSIIRSRGGR